MFNKIHDIESIREGFTEALTNQVAVEMSTEEEFIKMFDPRRSDFDFNPFEDYYLVYLYIKTHNIDKIAEKVGRSKRACALRLRLFFDFPQLDPTGPPMNRQQTKRILEAFRTRAEKYASFLDECKTMNDFLDLLSDGVDEEFVV